jgi:hypothetical protein
VDTEVNTSALELKIEMTPIKLKRYIKPVKCKVHPITGPEGPRGGVEV